MFSSSEGSSVCSFCFMGTFISTEGASSCSFCSKGAFMPVDGASVCRNCPTGFFSNVTGAISSSSCIVQDQLVDIELVMRSAQQLFVSTVVVEQVALALADVLEIPAAHIKLKSVSSTSGVGRRQLQLYTSLVFTIMVDASLAAFIRGQTGILGALNHNLDLRSIPTAVSFTVLPLPATSVSLNIGLIVGCVVGGLVLIILLVGVVIWHRRKVSDPLKVCRTRIC
mmetsp:Transcript_3546/g.10359  ORF Transcript_3546/g.10359 Transcript_3546/m.10359 type:complete len:225 (+) Transcript_3546:2299-2973(+)